jgi:chromosome segregation ATPase
MNKEEREELFEMLTEVTKKNSEEMYQKFSVSLENTEDTLRKAFSDESKMLRDKFEILENKMGSLYSEFGEMKVEFGDIKTEIGELKTDVGELKADVGELKVDVRELKADVGELKADVSELKADVSELKKTQEQHGITLDFIKNFLLNNLVPRIEKLEEGYQYLLRLVTTKQNERT